MAAIDIDEPAQYPVVLSDALMGLSTNEVYTAIRYNHKPENDPNSSSSLRLQPSSDSDSQSYDLSLKANSDRYSYHGVRKSGDGQYVLIFDHEKKHFVLHRIDSTFDMNLISTPWETDPTTLQRNYAQLEGTKKPPSRAPAKRDPTLPKETKKRPPAAKPEPKKPKAKPKPKPKPVVVREPSPEEEEDEDSDDGFIVEYPDEHGPTSQIGHQPSTTFQHEASEESDEDQDAEGEDDDMYPQLERNQDVEHFDLSAPFNDNSGGIDEDDFGDLEAELEKELQKMKDTGDESSESEEE